MTGWPAAAIAALIGLAAGPWQRAAIVTRVVPEARETSIVPEGEPLRQACPQCRRLAPGWTGVSRPGWWPLTPSGQCPGCRARIGPPPLVIELLSAALLAGLALRVHAGLVLAAGCWFAAFALPLGWIDAVMRRLPDALTWPAYAGTLALLLVAAAVSGNWAQFGVAAAGGAAAGGGFALITLVSPRAAGLGDAKLTLGLGTLLAWGGWTVLLAGVAAGFALAACYGLGLLAARRATLSAQVPFGPFLIAGTFALVLLTGR